MPEEAARAIADVVVNSAVDDIHSARWRLGEEIPTVYRRYVAANTQPLETCRLLRLQVV